LLSLILDLFGDSVRSILASDVCCSKYFLHGFNAFRISQIFRVTRRRTFNPACTTCSIFLIMWIYNIACICINYLLF
jgi:hypothetical protein